MDESEGPGMLRRLKHGAVFLRNFETHSSVPSLATSSNICMRAAADEERDEAGGGNIFDQSGRAGGESGLHASLKRSI